ncbi:PVC-type heme-binding CxxCH protein [Thalassotalea sp. PLHSN55]|uniref:PVC-type heme-binding CxxCH protein n=1 Tax=Thalassotalea sp. PLHSN55 TaxID=3435888 RepID=UPI003F826699
MKKIILCAAALLTSACITAEKSAQTAQERGVEQEQPSQKNDKGHQHGAGYHQHKLATKVNKGDRAGHVMKDPIPAEQIPPAPILTVAQALDSIKLQPGFVLENVVSEPNVFNPVAMTFDGNGRMWVCEMTTYMPTVYGEGEDAKEGNIVVLTDTNGDGTADKRTVFIDNIDMPRAVAMVKGGILYADQNKLYFAEVKEGLTLGKHDVVDPTYAQGGTLEHKTNALLHGIDNWYYNAKSWKKYKTIPLNEEIPAGGKEIYRNQYWKLVIARSDYRGQWGLSMDDFGRLYHNGNSSPASGEFLRPGALIQNPDYQAKMSANKIGGHRVYPIRMNPGVNRGYLKGTLVAQGEHKGKLVNFTAASGNEVYRGDNFPSAFYGASFTPEPAANLISARYIVETDGKLSGQAIYPQQEILASTDERFRPVNLYTAPDGSMYIIDMYHGILQHKDYLTTYLNRQIISRALDKNNNTMGRIYRLRWQKNPLSPQPKLRSLSADELVPFLAHNNGWWRDTTRRLLTEKNDESVAAAITELIKNSKDQRVIVNALWTLHALNHVSLDLVNYALTLPETKIKVNAIAIADKLSAKEQLVFAKTMKDLANSNYEVALQIALSSADIRTDDTLDALKIVLETYGDKPLVHDVVLSGLTGRKEAFLQLIGDFHHKPFLNKLANVGVDIKEKSSRDQLSLVGQRLYDLGKKNYLGKAVCSGCHGDSGEGIKGMGAPFIDSEWVLESKEQLAKVLLHGLMGPITVNRRKWRTTAVMPGSASRTDITDEDLAAIATYIRNSWGNAADIGGEVSVDLIKKVRKETQDRTMPYTAQDIDK